MMQKIRSKAGLRAVLRSTANLRVVPTAARTAVISLALSFVSFGALFASYDAAANVTLKNGNFFIGYTDIVYPGGFEPKMERVYNSKTSFKGMYGWGWGNEYEVYLSPSADGSVVVHEYGGGAENRFSPVAFKSQDLDKAVDMISEAAMKAGSIGSQNQLAAYKGKLRADASYRNDEWENLRKQGKLQPRALPAGTQLHSNKFSYQNIVKVASGYVRNFDNGKVETFDEQGRLQKIQDKNGNIITLSYGKDGKLAKLVDNFNRKMFFTFNTQGFLERIEGENGKKAEFTYNGLGELVSSKDVDGNSYQYAYGDGKKGDGGKRHNMVEIAYSDKTSTQVEYYGRDKQESVRAVKDRDGTRTAYSYDTDASDKSHTSVAVAIKGSDGKDISNSKYEYFIKRKADGEEWTYKMVTTLDGDRTETSYNECCGLPLLIKHGGEETAFAYDSKGHVTKKITPSEITELAYDPVVSKVTKVKRYSKTNPKSASWSEFTYDNKGNLTLARNSEKKGVKLFYDANGRIKSLVDQSSRRIDFKYNENSKPIEITDPQLGTITVSYTNSGEIKKVESTAGRKIALQVTSAFQNLLDIIRPAGVSLSF
jgi:YD repeat-containing protein